MVFDPDVIQKQLDSIDAAEFGRLVAMAVKQEPTSQNWRLVNKAIELKTGFDAEHEQVSELIERISATIT